MALDDAVAALRRSLTNHTPSAEGIQTIEAIREAAFVLGELILTTTPPSRERSIAVHELEDAVMWAVKGVVLAEG